MTTFDERDKAFENKFAHDNELAFKIHARTSRLAALWASSKLGQTAAESDAYANEVVQLEMSHDNAHLAKKLLADFERASVTVTAEEVNAEITRLAALAKAQVMGEIK